MVLDVFLEHFRNFTHVGSLSVDESPRFTYSSSYLALQGSQPIFTCLPLSSETFDGWPVRAAFDSLVPEGQTRIALAERFGVSAQDYVQLLARLSDETIGALIFCQQGDMPAQYERYERVDVDFFNRFAETPRTVARNLMGETRLSIAGEMTKVGLYLDEDERAWYLPFGSAPSTHIIKAPTGDYANQSINEALCLLTAKQCNIDVAETSLIRASNGSVLLVTRRFDRPISTGAELVSSHARPERIHQEDMCQALGIIADFKYEPTGAEYIELITDAISKRSQNAFGEKNIFLEQLFYHHLIGDCDGHLKNYSLLYPALSNAVIAPLYDVTCTTIYEGLSRDEGIRLNASRNIDKVTAADLVSAVKRANIPASLGCDILYDLAQTIEGGLEAARDLLVEQGFTEARTVAETILEDMQPRLTIARDAVARWSKL